MTDIMQEPLKGPVGGGSVVTVTPAAGDRTTAPPAVKLTEKQEDAVKQDARDYKINAVQISNRIDRATEQAARELERKQRKTEEQLQTQRNEVAAAEARELDNQALTSALQGEKGGMQQLQQDAVRTWAAKNRRAIQKAQAELAEETARQIAQLRADGEFERADDILDQSQIYMRGMEDVGLRVEEGIMTPELVEPVLGYFLRPDETETAEEASNAADDPAPGRTDEQPEDAEAARKAWEAVHALGRPPYG